MGDRRAEFLVLFRALAPEVRRWAARVAGADNADDVVAESFLVVWRRWEALPEAHDARRAWIYVVARHKAAHIVASRKQAARLHLALVGDAQTRRHYGADIADRVIASDEARRALNELSSEDQEVLILVGVEGLSTQDAAAVLECTVGAFATRLSRARRRLDVVLERSDVCAATSACSGAGKGGKDAI